MLMSTTRWKKRVYGMVRTEEDRIPFPVRILTPSHFCCFRERGKHSRIVRLNFQLSKFISIQLRLNFKAL
jgi:hypothetical protein